MRIIIEVEEHIEIQKGFYNPGLHTNVKIEGSESTLVEHAIVDAITSAVSNIASIYNFAMLNVGREITHNKKLEMLKDLVSGYDTEKENEEDD